MNLHHSKSIFPRNRCRGVKRRGLSLIEVMFATGVLLVGLLGLASVLPIAANNALQSLNSDRARENSANQQALINVMGSISVGSQTTFFTAENRNPVPAGSPVIRYPVQPNEPIANVPDVFCVDPWFLTSADTLRPVDATRSIDPTVANGFDRSLFPCYDDQYAPPLSPSAKLEDSQIGRWSPRTPFSPGTPGPPAISFVGGSHGVRMPRVGLTDITNAKYHEQLVKDQDSLSVILNAEDKSLPPGLFVKRSNSGTDRTTTTINGRYSNMLTIEILDRTGPIRMKVDAITFRDREIAVNPTGDFVSGPNGRHQLMAYTASPASDSYIPLDKRTFSDERLGYVITALRMNGNDGEFEYMTSEYVDPTVKSGDWLLLLRRNYGYPAVMATSPLEVGSLEHRWTRIESVSKEPVFDGSLGAYRTTVKVKKLDWIFHPIQSFVNGLGYGPYKGNVLPNGFNRTTLYDYFAVTGDPTSDNIGHTATLGDPMYGTTVVLMKNVVSVDTFEVSVP